MTKPLTGEQVWGEPDKAYPDDQEDTGESYLGDFDMWKKIMLALAVAAIETLGPVVIKLIVDWLSGMSDEEKVAFLNELKGKLEA